MRQGPELIAPVTRYLHSECARQTLGQTVVEALTELRANRPAERVIHRYVVDAEGRLQWMVPTWTLLLSTPDQRLEEVMIKRVVSIPVTATLAQACEVSRCTDWVQSPSSTPKRRLQGVVNMEFYTDELDTLSEAEKRADLFRSHGRPRP